MNESEPNVILALAGSAIAALNASAVSPGEKAAALRTAAFAVEQAAAAQTQAQILANLIDKSAKP